MFVRLYPQRSHFMKSLSRAMAFIAIAGSVQAQEAPPEVSREFRAAWVATVANIDWPSKPGLSSWEQQGEMIAILNKAVQLNLNAIILQVRPATDAMFDAGFIESQSLLGFDATKLT